ncbi:MAG: tetratricopeptide repeat protein [Planctomycetaceae bacterium]|nr:tetratricopeptide repeat protein [Planctomycetaceae bacterium]
MPITKKTLRLSLLLTLTCMVTGCNTMASRSHNSNGIAYFKQGEYQLAAEEFKRAVADKPDNASHISNYATAMRKTGNMARAEESYKHALNIDPSHQPSYHGLATMYMETGRPQMATALLQGWVETQPYNPGAHVEMAWAHRKTGNYAAAEQELQSALKINPNHPVALAQLGQIYQDTGRQPEALAMYQSSLVSNWSQPEVHNRVAQLNPNPAFHSSTPTTAYQAQSNLMTASPGPMMVPQGPVLAQPMTGAPAVTSAPIPDPNFVEPQPLVENPAAVESTDIASEIPEVEAH